MTRNRRPAQRSRAQRKPTPASRPYTSSGTRVIDLLAPYGDGKFGAIGASLNVRYDTRRSLVTDHENLELPFADNPAAGFPISGIFVDVTGRFSPPVWVLAMCCGLLPIRLWPLPTVVAIAGRMWTLSISIPGPIT